MKIAWLTPYRNMQNSAVGRFGSLGVGFSAARGHLITLFASDKRRQTEHRYPRRIEPLHWPLFENEPAAVGAYNFIVCNIANHFEYHFGVLRLIDCYPGCCLYPSR
jgi:hypothetical protein